MRTLPEAMVDALSGSTGAEASIQFNVWYDGQLVTPDLPVSNWGISWDISRQVQCQMKGTVLDDDGTLTPWDLDDPLGAGGALLQTRINVGNDSAGIGFQTITSAEPDEAWRLLNGATVWVPGGASIPIEAEDLTESVIAYDFMAPQQPLPGNTIIKEITALLTGLMDVVVDTGITDKAVPGSIVYKESRMDAVEDLVKALGMAWKVTGDGQFRIYDPAVTTVRAIISGGMEGQLIRVRRSLKMAANYNGFVSRNTAEDGRELQGVAKIEAGPPRWGGPLKYRTYAHKASFANTQEAINATAASLRDNRARALTTILPLRVVLNPAIELGDFITVNLPLPDGGTAAITGRVLTIDWSGNGSGLPVGMDVKLECNVTGMRAVAKRVKDAQWRSI